MKPITMFIQARCPYCLQARCWMDELFAAHPEYRDIPLTVIDELKQPALADQYDYWLVPTFYMGDKKVHEGAATPEIVQNVFSRAFEEAE